MLEIDGLTRRVGAKTAVDGVSLVIPPGQMVGVIGRSGAGKSTLLRMINRLTDPEHAPRTVGRRRRHRAEGPRAARLAHALRHDLPAVQAGATARRHDQAAGRAEEPPAAPDLPAAELPGRRSGNGAGRARPLRPGRHRVATGRHALVGQQQRVAIASLRSMRVGWSSTAFRRSSRRSASATFVA